MQSTLSPYIALSILGQLFAKIDSHIEMSELQLLLPAFLFSDLGFIIRQQPQQQHMSWPRGSNLAEETLDDVPKLMKDNLMPKDANQEKKLINLSNFVPKLSKIPSKRNVSVLSKRTAASLGEKLQSLTSRQSRNASSISKCQPIKVEQNEEESYDMFKMRQRTQARMQYLEQMAKMKIQREKSFASQLQIMKTLQRQDGLSLATFDYDGQPMLSSILDDTIQHYHMRADFGPTHRKMRQLYAEGPVECIVEISKSIRQKDHQKVIKPMEMPVPPNPPYNHQPKSIKLEEYRKHYGRKYTRLDHLSRTIEIPSSREGPQDLFSGQKQLRDFSTMVSSQTARSRQTLRRLALPRLHGKYKVLDRYQALD